MARYRVKLARRRTIYWYEEVEAMSLAQANELAEQRFEDGDFEPPQDAEQDITEEWIRAVFERVEQ